MVGTRGPDPPPHPLENHKLLYMIYVLTNTGPDPPRKAIRPKGPIASRGRSIQPSMLNNVDH